MTKTFIQEPPNKQNFIALYEDGSGAELFYWANHDEIYDCEGDLIYDDPVEDFVQTFLDMGYQDWLPLPDGFTFWFMHNSIKKPNHKETP